MAVGACGRDRGPATTTAPRPTGPPATLPFRNVDRDELARQARLSFPSGTADFLSAQLANRRQLDVTFTLAPTEVDAFVRGSRVPVPRAGRRVVTHTSPLWKLNPGTTIRGATDVVRTPDGLRLRRDVELVDEPGGRVRVRLVVSPA